jgi:hypothetical protein
MRGESPAWCDFLAFTEESAKSCHCSSFTLFVNQRAMDSDWISHYPWLFGSFFAFTNT